MGNRTRLQFEGVELQPLQPLAIALMHGCGFIARGFTGDLNHLTSLMVEALSFKGLSYLDVIQPCISWGTHSVDWYKDRIYSLPESYNTSDREMALKKCVEWDNKIPIGILYQEKSSRHIFGDTFRKQVWDRRLTDLDGPSNELIQEMLEEYT